MSALDQNQTFAPQKIMSALPPRKRTFAVQLGMSALDQKRTSRAVAPFSYLRNCLLRFAIGAFVLKFKQSVTGMD
jgi:hypothetical protein